MTDKPVRMVCEACGSEHVTHDAWAEWDGHTQRWVLGAVFDYAFCHKCDEETHIVERPRDIVAPAQAGA